MLRLLIFLFFSAPVFSQSDLIQQEIRSRRNPIRTHINNADRHYDNGRKYFTHGKYDRSAKEFILAIETFRKSRILGPIGQDRRDAYLRDLLTCQIVRLKKAQKNGDLFLQMSISLQTLKCL